MSTQGEFWNEFKKELKKEVTNIGKQFSSALYLQGKEYTNFMTRVLWTAVSNLGFSRVHKEYFRIDVTAFYQRTYADWDLEIAIEHELGTGLDEITKLAHVNAGLKVSVLYHDFSELPPLQFVKENLVSIIEARKYRSRMDSWLFVVGNRNVVRPSFGAYTYDGNKIGHLDTIQL
jgi:hypothetical protein